MTARRAWWQALFGHAPPPPSVPAPALTSPRDRAEREQRTEQAKKIVEMLDIELSALRPDKDRQ